MEREDAIGYVSVILDDTGNFYATESDFGKAHPICASDTLIGWQCGFEPMFVAVRSYLGVVLDLEEAEEIAMDYLTEKDWFSGAPRESDHCFEGR